MSGEFGRLYRAYADDVFRFALYLCGDRAEAEDIASETFVHAFAAREPVRMGTAKGYLLTIARNLHLQRARTRSRQVPLDAELRDPRAGPELQGERSEELAAALEGLQRLPEPTRAALLMSAVDGLPHDEIARSLGLSVGAVKVRIHRARLALAGVRSRPDRKDTT